MPAEHVKSCSAHTEGLAEHSALRPSRCRRQAVKKARLPTIRLHDLRHTHATLALQAGIHPKVVSERPR
jgi:integrase